MAEDNKKVPTAEDFITNWPLYSPFDFEDYSAPQRISFHCPGVCKKETTWALSNKTFFTSSDPNFYHVHYQCTLCAKFNLVVCYLKAAYKTRQVVGPQGQHDVSYYAQVLKIGQYPSLTINISKALENNLGEASAGLYKKALVSRNSGYGLGAISYIRRVVEDKTEELIEAVAKHAESINTDAKTVEAIRAAKVKKITYDEKLKIASAVMPKSLLIDGLNPLEVLYGLVSVGLHNLTEEQCVDIADEGKTAFEFTFANLRAETDERKDFAESIKKLERKLSALRLLKAESPEKTSAEPSKSPRNLCRR